MNILFIGDIFGYQGINIIQSKLNLLKKENDIDFVIANAENTTGGKGLSCEDYKKIIDAGVDFITMGNHTWFQNDVKELLKNSNILRPLNLNKDFKYANIGVGSKEIIVKSKKIRITNLLGNTVGFKNFQNNCFKEFQQLLNDIEKPDIHIVDLHTETTSEKNAFLWSFNGLVEVIVGTHTHIATSDSVITHENTAYISDVGMTGPSLGVIGGEKTNIINKFFNPEDKFHLSVQDGPKQLSSILISFDKSNLPVKIKQIIIKEGFKFLGEFINYEN